MQLFVHDEKHDQIVGTLDLGDITVDEMILVEKIIRYLDTKQITTRYKRLVLAEKYTLIIEDEEPNITFEG